MYVQQHNYCFTKQCDCDRKNMDHYENLIIKPFESSMTQSSQLTGSQMLAINTLSDSSIKLLCQQLVIPK